jgi:hypothetical protein
MKKINVIFMLLFVISSMAIAQKPDWSSDVYRFDEIYPGYIVKTNGEKIEGYLRALHRGQPEDGISPSNQTRCEFYSDPKNKKTKVVYKVADLQGYKIADKYYKSIGYSGGLTSKINNFCLQTSTGRIASYVWYSWEGGVGGKWVEKSIIQKADEKPIEESSLMLGFAKKMSEMVSDYPELAAKVLNKEKGYGVGSFFEVIKEYNEWYAKNNPQN